MVVYSNGMRYQTSGKHAWWTTTWERAEKRRQKAGGTYKAVPGVKFNKTKSEFRKKDNDSTVINFYTKVIFPSNEAKEEFYKKANIPANEEYITFEQLKRYFQ